MWSGAIPRPVSCTRVRTMPGVGIRRLDDFDDDRPAVAVVLDRVREQIEQHLTQPQRVGDDEQARRQRCRDCRR